MGADDLLDDVQTQNVGRILPRFTGLQGVQHGGRVARAVVGYRDPQCFSCAHRGKLHLHGAGVVAGRIVQQVFHCAGQQRGVRVQNRLVGVGCNFQRHRAAGRQRATAAVVLLVVGLLLGAVVYLGLHYGEAADSRVRIGTLAEALIPTADGLQLDPARTPADWLQGYAWAMVLDDDGSVIWQHDLPQNLNKHYTASEIASFSRWYLDDWPVFCWTADYGLFVAAMPRGSVWRCNIYNNAQLMNAMAAGMLPALALLLGVPAACCLLFSWRGARRLQTIAAGLATVADGGTIRLPTDGFAGELADTVNRTSEQLRRRNEIIARRDDARTSWIAGVSHDVRTPLALILGWAEQLEQDTALPAAARQKACGIRTQSEKLRALIEDLNLTSKLQYGAQPLRCQPTQAGPLLRRLAAEFCDSPHIAPDHSCKGFQLHTSPVSR